MLPHPRAYRDEQDWNAMLALLSAGRAADTGTYYVHPGDVCWWLHYSDPSLSVSEQVWLWEAPLHGAAQDVQYGAPLESQLGAQRDAELGEQQGAHRDAAHGPQTRLLGWVLLSPAEECFDLFVAPELRGSAEWDAMHRWSEERITELLARAGKREIKTMWIAETDVFRRAFLESRGFTPASSDQRLHKMYLTAQDLGSARDRALRDEVVVRACRGEVEIDARARAQYGAFRSSWAWEDYLARWRRFFRSPVYRPECDIVAEGTSGEIGAFAIHWMDPLTKDGHFEPVGTHPDYQRRGFGRAVLEMSLRRLEERGMERAFVCCEVANFAALALYESCGFRIRDTLLTYVKQIG